MYTSFAWWALDLDLPSPRLSVHGCPCHQGSKLKDTSNKKTRRSKVPLPCQRKHHNTNQFSTDRVSSDGPTLKKLSANGTFSTISWQRKPQMPQKREKKKLLHCTRSYYLQRVDGIKTSVYPVLPPHTHLRAPPDCCAHFTSLHLSRLLYRQANINQKEFCGTHTTLSSLSTSPWYKYNNSLFSFSITRRTPRSRTAAVSLCGDRAAIVSAPWRS